MERAQDGQGCPMKTERALTTLEKRDWTNWKS
nr:MAG TPA: hypothetical protein [Caudoviricetes sp.]